MSARGWHQVVGQGAAFVMIVTGLLGLLGMLKPDPVIFVILGGLVTVFTISGIHSWKALRDNQDPSA